MELLCHRGIWVTGSDQNSLEAMARALTRGFGIETDVRDHNGQLVISHDPPTGRPPTLAELLDVYRDTGADGCLAINVKADGMAVALKMLLTTYGIANYFVFDMSIPEALRCRAAALSAFQRVSDYEQPLEKLPAAGLWVDCFEETWYRIDDIQMLAHRATALAFVSPELHGRNDQEACWELLQQAEERLPGTRFLLCTDQPERASEIFNSRSERP